MRNRFYLLLLLFLGVVVGCTKDNLTQQPKTNEDRIINAEMLLESKPNEALQLLESIPEVDSMSDALFARWNIVYGKATDKLTKNELLSLPRLTRAFAYCEERGTATDQAWITFILGNAYNEFKDGTKTIELYSNALRLADLAGESKLAGDISFAIGDLYLYQEMDAQAQEKYGTAAAYYQRANKLREQVKAMGFVAHVLVYRDSLQSALTYASKIEELANASGNSVAMGNAAGVLARIYTELADYTLAENYALKGILLDTVNTAPHYVALADLYMRQQKFDQARDCLQKAETVKSLNKHVPIRVALYRAQIDQAEGKTTLAQASYKRYTVLRDSLSVPVKAYQLLQAEQLVKQLQIDHLEVTKQAKTNNIILLIGVAVLFTVLLGMLYIPYVRKFLCERAVVRRLREIEIQKEILDDNSKLLERINQKQTQEILFGDSSITESDITINVSINNPDDHF